MEGCRLYNIENVVTDGLCTGCGACVGVCPVDALSMRLSEGILLPDVDESRCTRCRLCVKCCTGHEVDFERFNLRIFGDQPDDHFVGSFRKCYVGHSNDADVLSASSSGGIPTHLLLFALEKGIIDGAVVVRMKNGNPLEPEVFVARTKEEIISASKSKYCPVPTDVGLKSVLGEEGRFAVVGLPCHMWGIRASEDVFKKLRDRIVLRVGLFCGHTVSFDGTSLLLRKFGVRRSDVKRLDYRGLGWPGRMHIKLSDGRSLMVRFNRGWNAYWNVFSPFFFTPLRCLMCPDHFNELADVSVGDAWLPELEGSASGRSVIVTRSKMAEELLAEMRETGLLTLLPVAAGKVKESQAFSLNFKKENLSARLSFLRARGRKTPRINPTPDSSRVVAKLGAFFAYASFFASSNKRLRFFLFHVPLPVFRLYFGLFKSVFILSHGR